MSDEMRVAVTLAHALKWATDRLAEADVESPRWDAEQLAAHVLGVKKSELVGVSQLDPEQHSDFVDLVRRRAERVPLQHLTGVVGFRYLELAVGPGVFIPRPETEVVAGYAIDHLRVNGPIDPVVVELCAGSAAIALSIAQEVPAAVVHAVEVDGAALEWARRNAEARLRVGDPPITLHCADVSTPIPTLAGKVDCVIANPPYVAEHEMHEVAAEVRDHDPEQALVAGPDGLDVIRLVVEQARVLLRRGGLVVIEHSDRQGESAPTVLRDAGGWADIEDHVDLTGRPRFVTATWADAPWTED
ncbi:MAG TPA: peptide chain release factor N(5)-glutamine methyltransferase [Mycobacteriales bacterium]|nr:peptide chain release factor N(5)-glutamine methyltransferase [Mycobacteriales bacterium]